MKLDRTFQFRGGRNYLHSSSVINDLLGLRGQNVENIDLKFHRKTVQQISYTDEPGAAAQSVAEWSDNFGRLFLLERSELINERAPYDENALMEFFEIEGKTIRAPEHAPGFTRTDAIIAAFKHLLQTVYSDIDRRYAFVRLRLDHCPTGAFEIRYVRDIGAFFQGDIGEAGRPVGQIFFGVW
jgi:hypothetical protein